MISKERREQLARDGQQAINDRDQLWRPRWQEIWRYTFPERDRDNWETTELYNKIYDSTAIDAFNRLGGMLMTGLIPPWQRWIQLTPGPMIQEDQRLGARQNLTMISEVVHNVLTNSNFVQEAQPTFSECALVGTGGLKMEPRFDGMGVRFKNVPIDTVGIGEGRYSRICYVYQKYEMPNHQIMAEYGDMVVNSELRTQFNMNPFGKTWLWSIVAPEKYDESTGKYYHLIMIDKYPDMPLRQDLLDYNPYIFTRWQLVPNHVWGRGIGNIAHYDIKNLNKISELFLQALALSVNGVYTAKDDGILNPHSIQLVPGVIIPVIDNDLQNPPMSRLDTPSDLNIGRLGLADLRGNISRITMADKFSPAVGQKLTATEIMQRAQLIDQNLGSAISIMTYEFLIPLVQNMLSIVGEQVGNDAMRNMRIDGRSVEVQFLGSLSQAQRQQEAQAMVEYTTVVASMAQLDPQSMAVVDVPKMLRKVSERMNVPPDIIRSDEQVTEYMQQAQQGLQQIAEATPDVGQ